MGWEKLVASCVEQRLQWRWMNLAAVLATVVAKFHERRIRFAVIGGLAMQWYGSARFTADVDFVVERDRQNEVLDVVSGLGYRTLHRSDAYSNHQHVEPVMGWLDFVYVSGSTAEKVFGSVKKASLLGVSDVAVPSPEILIAMKLQAIRNDGERLWGDLADVEILMKQAGDMDVVQGYFERYGMMEHWDAIRRRI